jgi:hypothetical protein
MTSTKRGRRSEGPAVCIIQVIERHARDACFFEYVVDAHSVKSGGAEEPPSNRKKMITLPAWHI